MRKAKITRWIGLENRPCINGFVVNNFPIVIGSQHCLDWCNNRIAIEERKIVKQTATYTEYILVCYKEQQ